MCFTHDLENISNENGDMCIKGVRLKMKRLKISKRIVAIMLTVIFTLSTVIGSVTFKDFGMLFLQNVSAASTRTLSLSKSMNSFGISSLGYPAKDGLWNIYASGNYVFCLNAGKAACTGDTVAYTKTYAVAYSKQSGTNKGIAKALTYYFKDLKGSNTKKNVGLIQAYIWACGKGKSKVEAVTQAGKNIKSSYNKSKAEAFCKKIADTYPQGTIYYYKVTKCKKKKKIDTHQCFLGWDSNNPPSDKGSITEEKSASTSETVELTAHKIDVRSSKGLAGAVFNFICDNKNVGTQTSNGTGIAIFKYTRTLKTKKFSSKKKYVKNWDELTVPQQKSLTKDGFYDCKAKARAAAKKEVKERSENALKTLKEQEHTWKVEEVIAPARHLINTQPITKKETKSKKNLSYTFYDTMPPGSFKLFKKSTVEDIGLVATLKGAVYGVYAAENINSSDNVSTEYLAGDLIQTIYTDDKAEASIENMIPGRYYVQEITPSYGFLRNDEKVYFTVYPNKRTDLDVDEELDTKFVQFVKTFGGEKFEKGATFELRDAQNKVLQTIVADKDGVVRTKELPFGTYCFHQTKGTESYSFIPDYYFTLNEKNKDGKVYELGTKDDEPEKAGIKVAKTTLISDSETNTKKRVAEPGIQFQIKNADSGEVVETITTDKDGIATSGELEPGTYIVHQINTTDNFGPVEDFKVTITPEDHTYKKIIKTNPYVGRKIRLHKTMSKNGIYQNEQNAVFYVLDADAVKDMDESSLTTERIRKEYVDSIKKNNEKAILGRMETDENGNCAMLLDEFASNKDFVVIQTEGATGYTLADVYYSKDNTPKKEGNVSVYKINADNPYDFWAQLELTKKKRIDKGEKYQLEPDAQFQVIDSEGNVVETLTTKKNGKVVSSKLAYGVYTIHQIAGAKTHEFIDDVQVTLGKNNKHKVVSLELVNEPEEVKVTLTKKSAETKRLLNNTLYDVYDEDDNLITTIQTGPINEDDDASMDGKAIFYLPYGTYRLKEIKASDGFQVSEKDKTFELNLKSAPDGTYNIDLYDEPIWGEVTLTKEGEVLTDYDKVQQEFIYENKYIEGAFYGLYAKEDIKDDAGNVVYKAGKRVSMVETNGDKILRFYRTTSDGRKTKDMYLGSYYIKEVRVSEEYALDTNVYGVVLTWDQTPGDVNEITPIEGVNDITDPKGNNGGGVSEGKYVLCEGTKLNSLIKDAVTVTFTWTVRSSNYTDVSADGDRSVRLWSDSNKNYYISSNGAGQVIYFNAHSSHMFDGCSDLEEIYFKNVDTSKMKDMSYMFNKDIRLKELDLRDFNTTNVENTSHTFAGCVKLEKIKTSNPELVKTPENYEEPKSDSITIMPKTTFTVGDTYKAENFTFVVHYEDDAEEEISVTDDDVTFAPDTALTPGSKNIKVTFKSDKYSKFGTVSTVVKVVDADRIDTEDKIVNRVTYHLDVEDYLRKFKIRVLKVDSEGNPVKGAKIRIKANADIKNSFGKVLVKKGDEIATKVSEDDKSAYVEFSDLPSQYFAGLNSTNSFTYVIDESEASIGYVKDNTSRYVAAYLDAEHVTKQYTVIGPSETSDVESDTEAFVTQDDLKIVNFKNTYITIRKVWDDDHNANGQRPSSITVRVRDASGAPFNIKPHRIYSITGDKTADEWVFVTDIPISYYDNAPFRSNFNGNLCMENPIANYTQEGAGYWDEEKLTYTIINKSVKTSSTVKKIWDDGGNADNLRPTMTGPGEYVYATLYQKDSNGTEKSMGKTMLYSGNNWTATKTNLDRNDADGLPYEYYWKEEKFDSLTNNQTTGYAVDYKYDGNYTEITNKHIVQKTSTTVKKVWDDENDKDGLRPKELSVTLLRYINNDLDATLGTGTLNDYNRWTITMDNLPKYDGNGNEYTYTWKEEPFKNLTGDSKTGYQNIGNNTNETAEGFVSTITNYHQPVVGSVTITKLLDLTNIGNIKESPTFTFTIKGVAADGSDIKIDDKSRKVIFTAGKIKEFLNQGISSIANTDVDASVVFGNLKSGTYTVTESGGEGFFNLDNITDTSSNATVSLDKKSVTFEIGPESGSGQVSLDSKATFNNKGRLGKVKVKKFKEDGNTYMKDIVFGLYDKNGNELSSLSTDDKGEVIFENLPIGDYIIKEKRTDKDYQPLKDPINVSVPITLTQEEVEEQHIDTADAILYNGNYYFYEQTYEVINDAKLKLPKTGLYDRIRGYMPLIFGTLFIIVGVMFGLVSRKRHKQIKKC